MPLINTDRPDPRQHQQQLRFFTADPRPTSINRKGRNGRHGKHILNLYSTVKQPTRDVVFYLKLRQKDGASALVRSALERICWNGWGHAKTRGMGRIRLKNFDPSAPVPDASAANGFVSLSHFTPSESDPTKGHWKLRAKHPVPAQFINGKRVLLGEEDRWRVKSFLRLRAGSCLFFKEGEQMREHYGRTLSKLLDPAVDHTGALLPPIFHYALAYPWPLKIN